MRRVSGDPRSRPQQGRHHLPDAAASAGERAVREHRVLRPIVRDVEVGRRRRQRRASRLVGQRSTGKGGAHDRPVAQAHEHGGAVGAADGGDRQRCLVGGQRHDLHEEAVIAGRLQIGPDRLVAAGDGEHPAVVQLLGRTDDL